MQIAHEDGTPAQYDIPETNEGIPIRQGAAWQALFHLQGEEIGYDMWLAFHYNLFLHQEKPDPECRSHEM